MNSSYYSLKNKASFCEVMLGIFLMFFLPPVVWAGAQNGPYVVWMNLDQSPDKERVDKILNDFAGKKTTDCDGSWLRSPMLYMRRRPAAIDSKLVDDVFVKKDVLQKQRLNSFLKNYRDSELKNASGLDGIIVYVRAGNARMMSLTTGSRRIETIALALDHSPPEAADIEAAFCALLPPITRPP